MDFSSIQDFDMQLLHVFNGSENVWLDQMAMAPHNNRVHVTSLLRISNEKKMANESVLAA